MPYFSEGACVVNTRELRRGDTSHGAYQGPCFNLNGRFIQSRSLLGEDDYHDDDPR